ncbi:hypothetical protein PFMC_03203 [Plasmodium falciparum CAMP/Malaysia]|uniref:RAP domain-containing protein n=1 Tax=Plasmodium falciparum (isolate Camp / Malaysia) TaxID=5835 RepID=A0A024X609_PLAFC|nr:hypothetical protein PFMC_03203 [Plasmodium falciparum CAMP/Malaysia]
MLYLYTKQIWTKWLNYECLNYSKKYLKDVRLLYGFKGNHTCYFSITDKSNMNDKSNNIYVNSKNNNCNNVEENHYIKEYDDKTRSIIDHLKNKYDITSNSLNFDIKKTKGEKENVFDIGYTWSTFFKCEKSLYNVISKYVSTDVMDNYLHSYLNYNEEDRYLKDCYKEDILSDNINIDNIEKRVNNILIYITSFYYKNIRDYNMISILSDKLIDLCKKIDSINYKNSKLIFNICNVYNKVMALNDELFFILFNILNKLYVQDNKNKSIVMKDKEVLLILKTLYNQNYKNHIIVDTIISYIKYGSNLNSDIIVDTFYYLTLLSRIDHELFKKIHTYIYNNISDDEKMNSFFSSLNKTKFVELEKENVSSTIDNYKMNTEIVQNISFKINITPIKCIKLLYSYIVLDDENFLNFYIIEKLLVTLCDSLKDNDIIFNDEKECYNKKKIHEMICIIRTYLRYKKPFFYNYLPKNVKRKLKEMYIYDIGERKIKEKNFNEKVSYHLKKLRIPHIQNVIKGGILFDILEKDKKLVWLCLSYHHYYVRTIDLTVEKLLQINLIKAMNYKISKIHYYQFSRMKAKKTRFEYIRMCRYYSLRDRRNYDDELEGWNLPYINWYHKKNKNVHISNYFYNYTPISQVEY